MKNEVVEALEDCPVIIAVKDHAGVEDSLESEYKIVFILFGDICNIADIVSRVKEAGKYAVVHVDLITGLANREISVDFIRQNTKADGIISTKPALIMRGRELSFFTVLRVFILDSMAYENIQKQEKASKPDVIEILPGLMPKVIKKISKTSKIPLIAGGLVSEKEDVMAALSAGAIAISSTCKEIWFA